MRILLLSTYFAPDIASTGVLMAQLAQELAQLGHTVTVVTSMPHYGTNRIWDGYRGRLVRHERQGPLDVYHLYLYVPGHKGRSLGRVLNYASFNALSTAVALSRRRHDIVLVPSPPLTNALSADLVARIWRVPFVYNVQDIWPDVAVRMGALTNPKAIALSRRLEGYVYRRAKAVTVISEGFRRNLLAKGVSPAKIEVIPNFVDTGFIRPLPRQNAFSAAHGLDGKFVVLFAGNIGNSQGLEKVLDAALFLSDLEDILFLIVGNGASRPDVEAHARRLELANVRFLPFQPEEALPEMYASSDVCLVPLRAGFTNESVPCKVFSITASARPLIASVDEGSDTWEFVQQAGCGVCVPPEAPQALAEAIRLLYADPQRRELLGRNGRQHVTGHYSPQTIAARYHDLLRRSLAERSDGEHDHDGTTGS